MPALDTACYQAYLDELSLTYPDSLNLLVIDGAPAHTSGSLRVPDNVLLVRLPPYSPELNPIERVWQDLRKVAWPHTAGRSPRAEGARRHDPPQLHQRNTRLHHRLPLPQEYLFCTTHLGIWYQILQLTL
jgi:hypothetical protein